VSFLDAILGRSKPVASNLDKLFALSGAAITLQVAANLEPLNKAAVVFKPASGAAFANAETEFRAVLAEIQGVTISSADDSFGYRWILLDAPDLETIVTASHAVNRSLEDHGFSPQLLCSLFARPPRAARSTGSISTSAAPSTPSCRPGTRLATTKQSSR